MLEGARDFAAPSRAAQGRRSDDLGLLARGGSLNLAGMVLGGILAFALVVVVTRGLGAEGAGVFFTAVALFMIASNVTELGADTGLVRAISRYRALGRDADVRPILATALWPVLATGGVAAALVFALAAPLARAIFEEAYRAEGSEYLRLFAPFLLVSGASTVLVSGARGFGTMAPYVLVENLGKPAARLLLVLGAVLLGLSATWIAFAWVIPVVAGFAVAVLVFDRLVRTLERDAGVPARRSRPPGLATEFWRFAGPRGLAGAFQVAITWLDVLLVSSMRTAQEAGVYAAVSRLVVMGTLALQAVRLALAPQLSGLLARDRKAEAEDLYRVATWWLIAASWPLYLAFATFAPFVLGLFGPEFPRGQHVLLILSLAMLVNLGTGNVTAVLLMGGRSSWNLFNTIGAVTLNVGLNLLLIPRLGIEGAAIAWTASIVFDNVAALLEVRFLLGIRPFGDGYWKVATGSLVCVGGAGLAARAALGATWGSGILALAVAGGLYGPLLWRLRHTLRLPLLVGAFSRRGGDGDGSAGMLRAPIRHRAPRSVREGMKGALRSWGVLTGGTRGLPSFLVIGAKRGGTTSLFDYLLQHPHVSPIYPAVQRIKGIRYFDLHYANGDGWYRSHFPTRARVRRMERRLGGPYLGGEASPYYLFHPRAPERAHRTVPDAKLIVILRDPVERAFSHYRERLRHGAEPLTFEEAIDAEADRVRGEAARLLADEHAYSYAHEHFTYVGQGEYAAPLELWLERFARERLLVVRSEDMFEDPAGLFRRVQAFLELPLVDLEGYGRLNYHPGSAMEASIRRRLREHFAPHNRRLAELIGTDFGWET